MDARPLAPTLRVDLRGTDVDPDGLLELPLPALQRDPDLQRLVDAEHYDEQILAALVSP